MYGRNYMPTLDGARSGDSWPWWNLGEVVRRSSNVSVGDAFRRKMPEEFDRVELKALQTGQASRRSWRNSILMTPQYPDSTRPGTGITSLKSIGVKGMGSGRAL